MTNPSAKPVNRSKGFDRTVIEGAASNEAVRSGHPDVGFEHLFLGLLVNGGPGALLLMDDGVGLAGARAAIDGLMREDLAQLGVDVPLPTPEDTSGTVTAGLLPLTPRLRELVDDCPTAGGDQALLAALIDDEGGRVRRLLDRLGTDADRIRRALDEPAGGQAGPAPSSADREPAASSEAAAEGWQYASFELEVPVSAERLWDLVGDPERRAEWDRMAVSSRLLDGGVVELTRKEGETAREWITHSVPGREVTWEQEAARSDIPPNVFRIAIEPIGDHARLHLRRGARSALRGRIANRVVRWFLRNDLRAQAQIIAQSAAS
ncbi:ClpA/ClpB-like protein [Murinocardiopsis flavida]|uniref:ClpA/ClpB-like protein n=2 Tax=Murinocardiopsis flavida TaxID=645275 RepID=A0A2P8C8U4_9ACTN|nr:ClpA/ClpB-like protein [Murinocardiopsis flavida]